MAEEFVATQRFGKHTPAEANARNNRRALFSAISAARFATQRCCVHASAAVNQHATIEEAVFSAEAAPRPYNEELRRLEWELRESVESAVGRIWQERN
jgi:hypothetical protein